MNFPDYLISQGWAPHRKIWDGSKWEYKACEFKSQYSCMQSGEIDYRFLKQGKEVIFGLNERQKPPTLVYPRPVGLETDDDMNNFILQHTNEEILKAIFV